MSDDDPFGQFNLKVLTIVEDASGMLTLNYDGMSDQHALWLLESASFLVLGGYWIDSRDEEDSEDDERL